MADENDLPKASKAPYGTGEEAQKAQAWKAKHAGAVSAAKQVIWWIEMYAPNGKELVNKDRLKNLAKCVSECTLVKMEREETRLRAGCVVFLMRSCATNWIMLDNILLGRVPKGEITRAEYPMYNPTCSSAVKGARRDAQKAQEMTDSPECSRAIQLLDLCEQEPAGKELTKSSRLLALAEFVSTQKGVPLQLSDSRYIDKLELVIYLRPYYPTPENLLDALRNPFSAFKLLWFPPPVLVIPPAPLPLDPAVRVVGAQTMAPAPTCAPPLGQNEAALNPTAGGDVGPSVAQEADHDQVPGNNVQTDSADNSNFLFGDESGNSTPYWDSELILLNLLDDDDIFKKWSGQE